MLMMRPSEVLFRSLMVLVMNVRLLIVVLRLMQSWHVVVLLVLEITVVTVVLLGLSVRLIVRVLVSRGQPVLVIFVLVDQSVVVVDHKLIVMGAIQVIVVLDVVKLVVIFVLDVRPVFIFRPV